MSKAIEYTKALIGIPSISGQEKHALRYVHTWMKAQEMNGIVATNLFVAGYKKGNGSKNALILTGHIDTVSAGAIESWQADPWQPHSDGDRLYGLGASDMKGGIAAAMAAIEAVKHPANDTWLVVVANEEVDGGGTAAFASYFRDLSDYRAVSAIIAEPTDLTRIEIGHRGNAFIELTFHGQAGHGSQQTSFQKSAIGKASEFLQEVNYIASELAREFTDPALGVPTIVPTGMMAGDATSPNKTSDHATIVVDIRTTPQLDTTLSQWLGALGEQYGFTWREIAQPVASCLCDEDAPIIQHIKQVVGTIPTAVSQGATDQGFLQAIGIDTVVFGPGEFAQAHAQNEWASCKKIEQATRLYQAVLKKSINTNLL